MSIVHETLQQKKSLEKETSDMDSYYWQEAYERAQEEWAYFEGVMISRDEYDRWYDEMYERGDDNV